MFRLIEYLLIVAFAMILTPLPSTAQPAGLQCFANAAVPPMVRSEGQAELAGDLVLVCSGGVPTPANIPVPQFSLSLSLSVPVTSRLLGLPWSEALLLIDEPPPASQLVCGGPGSPEISPGICSIMGTGTGQGTYNGSPGRPNVFQGQWVSMGNQIVWPGVAIDPPGTAGSRILRITNVRANASVLPPPVPPMPQQIMAMLSSSGFPIVNPQQVVGFVMAGLNSSVQAPREFRQCVAQNPALAQDPASNGTSQFSLRFSEAFATAFKKMNTAPVVSVDLPPPLEPQNLPGVVYNTETGFYNPAFPALAMRGNLAVAGLPVQGTRFVAQFHDVPRGVKLFSQARIERTNGGQVVGAVRMLNVQPDGSGPFTPAAGNAYGIAPIPNVNGVRAAVYEVMVADPMMLEQFDVPIYVAYAAAPGSYPGLGTVQVDVGYGPEGFPGNADTNFPVPRFAALRPAITAFHIGSCINRCAWDVSSQAAFRLGTPVFVASLQRWLQTVTIRNTSASPIPAPVSLVVDNLSSNAVLVNATGYTSCAVPQGSPYANALIPAGEALPPGDTATVLLQFANTGGPPFVFTTRVLSGIANR